MDRLINKMNQLANEGKEKTGTWMLLMMMMMKEQASSFFFFFFFSE
jgi:hypothetical protein